MRQFTLAFLLLLPAQVGMAKDIVTPEAFEALSTGNTLYFNKNGTYFGAEQYFQNRKVYWQYLDSQCLRGKWYGQGSAICFEYENQSGPQCWSVWQEAGRLYAQAIDGETDSPLELVLKDKLPLPCAGPDLGM